MNLDIETNFCLQMCKEEFEGKIKHLIWSLASQ